MLLLLKVLYVNDNSSTENFRRRRVGNLFVVFLFGDHPGRLACFSAAEMRSTTRFSFCSRSSRISSDRCLAVSIFFHA